MCLSKYSNIALLKEVAMNLHLSNDHENIDRLCEKELAAFINSFYQSQECEVTSQGEKRKNEVETDNDIKKLKVSYKNLSILEMLPNEVYDKILRYLRSDDKKNMRMTSKRLYHRTTQLLSMFQNWCFDASRGTPPDFVLETDKNFSVYVLKDDYAVDTAANLINRFAHRISKVNINSVGFIMNYWSYLKPAEYPHLTTLDLERVHLDNDSLLMLAPQLEYLRMSKMKNLKFDISSVDEDSKCFTKLKALKLKNIDIDAKKILMKCCNRLKCLELSPLKMSYNLQDLDQDLSNLENLSLELRENDSENVVKNVLTKCPESLRALKLNYEYCKVDFSPLLENTMKITTLEIQTYSDSIQGNIESFLKKCPKVQKLSLSHYDNEIKEIVLKDLTYLKLWFCGSGCMTSVLKQASKYSVKTVNIAECHHCTDCHCTEFSVLSELDTLLVHECAGHTDQALDRVGKLFPSDVEVTTEKLEDTIVFRRVYGLQ